MHGVRFRVWGLRCGIKALPVEVELQLCPQMRADLWFGV